jgi:DNA-binding XRE family transcriptional regulator
MRQDLHERRKRLDLSRNKLAQFLEMGLHTYEKVELGSRPVPKTKAGKFSMYQNIEDIDILIGIYHGKTVSQVYRSLCEDEG